MNRRSKLAQTLALETGASPRQIERWSLAGLIPAEAPHDVLSAYVRALMSTAGQGRDHDLTALLMASRHGLGCPLLPAALVRMLKLDDPELEEWCRPVETDEHGAVTDTGFIELEERASAITDTSGPELPFVSNIAKAPQAIGEPPEQALHSVVTSMMSAIAGDGAVATAPMAVFAGLGSPESGYLVDGQLDGPLGVDLSVTFGSFKTNPDAVRRLIESTPPADLAKAIRQFRETLALIGVSLPKMGDLDIMAATTAPIMMSIARSGTSPLVADMLDGSQARERAAELAKSATLSHESVPGTQW